MDISITRRRVKYARIEISRAGGVKVIIPMRYTEFSLRKLLSERDTWIRKHLANFEKTKLPVKQHEVLLLGKTVTPSLFATGDESWYRAEAKAYIEARLREYGAKFGFTYNNVTIRSARSRWGSCSAKKNLSFNWRLIKAPQDVVDYVILHELVHTEIMDHSKRFWSRVAEVCPRYKEHKAWLKTYGHNLD